jgi:glycosyltransferase involved in cell wall biosynthesis
MSNSNSKIYIAIALMIKNESERIIDQLTYLTSVQTFYPIYVFDDNSTDDTQEKVEKFAKTNNLVHLDSMLVFSSFADKKNYICKYMEQICSWCLFVDCDEQFDPAFLCTIQSVIKKNTDTVAFKFPRINLPHGQDYPDYQVRLLNLDEPIEWQRDIHEVPFIKRENGNSKINLHDYINTKALNDCPILHSKRNGNKREWW